MINHVFNVPQLETVLEQRREKTGREREPPPQQFVKTVVKERASELT
jgi:hypothetical protein